MSGPGRPRIGTPVKICIPDAVREQVAELAAAEGVTVSEWIRRAIDARITASQPTPTLSVAQVLEACRAAKEYARTCPELRRAESSAP